MIHQPVNMCPVFRLQEESDTVLGTEPQYLLMETERRLGILSSSTVSLTVSVWVKKPFKMDMGVNVNKTKCIETGRYSRLHLDLFQSIKKNASVMCFSHSMFPVRPALSCVSLTQSGKEVEVVVSYFTHSFSLKCVKATVGGLIHRGWWHTDSSM